MVKSNSNKNSSDINLDFFRFIVYGYIKNNYSNQIAKNLEYHVIKSSIKSNSAVAVVMCRGCGEFKLEINIDNKSIIHLGDYAKNRKYPSDKIIELALTKFNKY